MNRVTAAGAARRGARAARAARALFAGAAVLLSPLTALAQAAAASAPPEVVTQFVAEPGLEEMKYRHLWIAYGAIWLIVMALVWRTARRQAELTQELSRLQIRVDEMEKSRD